MPDDINENWTEEQFALIFQKRNERIRALNQTSEQDQADKPAKRISDMDFFTATGVTVARA